MANNHAYCMDCDRKVKQNIAEESTEWNKTDEGWKCGHCNPNSDVSW